MKAKNVAISVGAGIVVVGGIYGGLVWGGQLGEAPGSKLMAQANAQVSLLEQQLQNRRDCSCKYCGRRYSCEMIQCPFCGRSSHNLPPIDLGDAGKGGIPGVPANFVDLSGGGDGGGGGGGGGGE